MIGHYPAPSTSEPASRRRLLRLIGAGGAALVAMLLPRNGAQATHGGGVDPDALHVGQDNFTVAPTTLSAEIPTDPVPDPRALIVFIPQGRAITGHSSFGVGVNGHSNGGDPPEIPSVGVEGTAHHDGIGVAGESKAGEGQGPGAGAGVSGSSGSGPGVQGNSESGPGALAGSTTGPGVDATSWSGPGAVGWSPSGVAGVIGIGSIMRGEGTVPEEARGLLGVAPGSAPAVQCVSGGLLDQDTHPWAPDPDGGLALDVVGKARFSTAGAATVPQGQNSVFVPNASVTPNSHISITLVSGPGPRQLRWIWRSGGSGFTVHFAGGPPGQRPATDFTYLIVEPPA